MRFKIHGYIQVYISKAVFSFTLVSILGVNRMCDLKTVMLSEVVTIIVKLSDALDWSINIRTITKLISRLPSIFSGRANRKLRPYQNLGEFPFLVDLLLLDHQLSMNCMRPRILTTHYLTIRNMLVRAWVLVFYHLFGTRTQKVLCKFVSSPIPLCAKVLQWCLKRYNRKVLGFWLLFLPFSRAKLLLIPTIILRSSILNISMSLLIFS